MDRILIRRKKKQIWESAYHGTRFLLRVRSFSPQQMFLDSTKQRHFLKRRNTFPRFLVSMDDTVTDSHLIFFLSEKWMIFDIWDKITDMKAKKPPKRISQEENTDEELVSMECRKYRFHASWIEISLYDGYTMRQPRIHSWGIFW